MKAKSKKTSKRAVKKPAKSTGKTTSRSVASRAARILATSTDADERAVAASALAQVETQPETVIVSGGGPFGPIDVPKFVDGKVDGDFGKVVVTSYPKFSLNDFIADVLANVGTGSSISYECYTAENVVEALSWLNYNGGYVYGSDGTRVEVRKRAQQ